METQKTHAIVFSLSSLATLAAVAATWTIHPVDSEGLTPSQQLTNAVTRAATGDTILFKSGTYQLDDASFMLTVTGNAGGETVTSRSYVYLSNKQLHFIGESEGAWSDGVVLRGNGKYRFARMTNTGSTFRNITFENFASSDHPELKANNSNLDVTGLGGVVFFSTWNAGNAMSNCVFRGNVARGGGATAYACATDCLYTNNVAYWGGGADLASSLTRCVLVDNKATGGGVGGATCWPRNLSECSFIGNSCTGYGGAAVGDENMVVEGCAFSNNVAGAEGGVMTLRRKTKVSRCVFAGNSAGAYGGAIASWAQSGANGGAGSVFTDCLFAQNVAKQYGGAVGALPPDANGPVLFRSCTFTENYAPGTTLTGGCVTYGGAYSNCTFYGNHATNRVNVGGIVGGPSDALVPVTDCVFSNNYNYKDGMVRYAFCTNTLFFGNEVPHDGGVVKRCRAVGCKFIGNRKYDTFHGIVVTPSYTVTPEANVPSGDATESTLVRCDMDLGGILNCVLVDCHIHTLTNKGAHCAFYGHNVATNCLIENCNPPDQNRGIVYRWGPVATAYVTGSDYVNCTFADNVVPFMYSHDQEHGIYTPFKSCLFYNNRNRSGELVDTKYRTHHSNRPAGASNLDSGFALSNCVFGVTAFPNTPGDIWRDLGGNKVIAPNALLVAGTRAAALGVHKYALRPESPAIGMGDASMFTAADLDYAGNFRLRDGRLDPGCFECWLNVLGTTVIIR